MKIYITVIACFLSFISFGQLAGTQEFHYTDIQPDTAIYCTLSGGIQEGIFMLKRIELDINGDAQPDFKVESRANSSMAQNICEVNVIPLNASSSVLIGRTDSVFNNGLNFWMIHPVAKPLLYGEAIEFVGSIWDSNQGTIYANNLVTGASVNINDFYTFSDRYIGIKYTDGVQTDYGWIRIIIDNTILVKDYSMSGNIIGLKEKESDEFLIYPNPAGNYIQLKGRDISISNVEMCDITGRKILLNSYRIDANTIEADVNEFPEGMFFLSFQTPDGPIRKKVLLKR